ncbi:uncharacterized protein TEOVI_000814500 [Trypanosoma equiperdum]|uniref:Uncharacterized protein n=1 Tax=Trypanosoma equiperdum TaxID=5694 RepID=A0A1G4I5H0_TRYEQ|nr:hypothetical protein, conserved [Trypanosoma equiperdum]
MWRPAEVNANIGTPPHKVSSIPGLDAGLAPLCATMWAGGLCPTRDVTLWGFDDGDGVGGEQQLRNVQQHSGPSPCAVKEGDEVLMYARPLPSTANEEEDEDGAVRFAQWCTPIERKHASDAGDSSQCSMTGHKARAALAMKRHHGDPGAPTKLPESRACIFSDADELTVPFAKRYRSFQLQGVDDGDSNKVNGSSVLTPCDSSNLSHITPLDEGGESIDLANHMSGLILAASPTPKKLDFVTPLEDGEVHTGDNGTFNTQDGENRPLSACSSTHRPLRGKRFLDDLDPNVGVATSHLSTCKSIREGCRKCRRVDAPEGCGGEKRQRTTDSVRM